MNDDTHILSVSDLTRAVKHTLESAFPFVWVRGQVANLSRPSSGHVYFSLVDDESSLAAVWFRGNQNRGERFDPLTGEVYEEGPRPSIAVSLENGMEIVCAGKLGLYGQRGVYQLIVELAQEAGFGKRHEEFALLRARLESLGFFAMERKRPLPANPRRVAVVTAPGGAAIYDFLRIAQTRGLNAAIRIYPTPVQGEGAPPAIISAMRRIWDEGWAQTIVLIRGGGSIEDLWAFNDERLARAVFASPIPVLAGIGHEVDFTFADLTADLRAATPTHAAQLLWPDRNELLREWRVAHTALRRAGSRLLERRAEGLERLCRGLEWGSPQRRITVWQDRLASVMRLLSGAGQRAPESRDARLRLLRSALETARDRLPAREGRLAELRRRLIQAGPLGLEKGERALAAAGEYLARCPQLVLAGAEHALERAALRLGGLNPHAPLERGYALAVKANGTFVRMKNDVAAGEALRLVVSDGDIPVRVEGDSE